jgi:hypothetical protein
MIALAAALALHAPAEAKWKKTQEAGREEYNRKVRKARKHQPKSEKEKAKRNKKKKDSGEAQPVWGMPKRK